MNFMTIPWRASQLKSSERHQPYSLFESALGMGSGVPV